MSPQPPQTRHPSRWWLILGGLSGFMAMGLVVAAVFVQREATKPIGEGDLFTEDAEYAGRVVRDASDSTTGVKTVRNSLEIETAALVSPDGQVLASTSPNLVGGHVGNDFLRTSIAEDRFAAIGTAIHDPILIDGVLAWQPGDVLYLIASPVGDGTAVLLYYDISELFARRAGASGIQPAALQLGSVGAVCGLIALALGIGHTRARRHQEALAKESELLREHARELGEANEELEKARRRAERALAIAEEKIRIRSEFVLMINHELRTPLTSVITGAKLLRDEPLGDHDRSRVLDAIVDDGTRLQEMIDQILAVARIENRGLAYELNDISTAELEEAISAAASDTEVLNEVSDNSAVSTDSGAVSLVVSSLAENARTHGASQVSITIDSRPRVTPMVEVGERPDRGCFISVSDDGPGIDREFLPRVFEKFEKSSFSPGTGLGLYMARTIVEALNGSIAVETSSTGTTFEIALPAVTIMESAGRP